MKEGRVKFPVAIFSQNEWFKPKQVKSLIGSFFLLLLLSSCAHRKSFPSFSSSAYGEGVITEKSFENKRTVVIMGHLSCAPMMLALKDFNTHLAAINDQNYQVLSFLENTDAHVHQFYHDTASIWNNLKNMFDIDTLGYPLITECNKERIRERKGGTQIKGHCRKLSWRLWVFSSPTFFIVDQNGNILKRKKGYPFYGNSQYREDWIKNLLTDR